MSGLFSNNSNRILLILLFTFLFFKGVSAQPQYYNFNTGGSSNNFPFNVTLGKEIQVLYAPGTFASPMPAPQGLITHFFLRASTTANANTFTDVVIKMGQTPDTSLPAGAWYTGTMTTVFSNPSLLITPVANDFFMFTLSTPFPYDPTQSLIVNIQQCGHTGTGIGVFHTVIPGLKRSTSLVGTSCPFVYGQQGGFMPHTGVNITPGGGGVQNFALRLPTPGVNTNYVAIPFNAGMIGFNNVTIEAWMKPGGLTTANTVLNKGAASFDYQLGVSATTGIPFFRAGASIATSTNFTVTANVWTHIAVTYDGTNVRFYKDGILVSTIPLTATLGSSSNEMRLGRGNADAGSGNLEEVRLWSVARTQGQIDSNKCKKWPSTFTSTTGLKAVWHLDSSLVDSVSGFNGTAMGNVGFDTVSFPIPGSGCTPTSITHLNTVIPDKYTLEQNYPNPFNPTTNIKFSIPKGGFVELKVYDLLGREVATLAQDPFEAGTYIIGFNAGNLSSGIYFYTLISGDFKETKRMLLIK